MAEQEKALRGRLLWFGAGDAMHWHEDGLLVIAGGHIRAAGDAPALLPTLDPATPIVDHRPHLILPGLIDAHLHFPQTQVVASWGAQLLDWLNRYTFVEEQKYADPVHAADGARFFLRELLRNGTTTASVYGSVHRQSVEALFSEAALRNMRIIAGKVMMDRNAPEALRDTPQSGYRDSKALIERWHGKGRALYAISPRFAITSTPQQLEAAGQLAAEHPDCLIQTHMSETLAEIATVNALYPDCGGYLGVYERYGLIGRKSMLGHCIHVTPDERRRMSASGAVAVFCPTSNLFLGSGLFDRDAMLAENPSVRIALATDIGAGTSYSMLATAGAAYNVLQLIGQRFTGFDAFRLMTRGNAEALGLEARIGGFFVGSEADCVVLDARATPAMAHRMATARDLADELFVLMTMGDDRNVRDVYVAGEIVTD